MLSNVWIALITSFSVLAGSTLTYFFNEIRERRLKREKEEELKQGKKRDFNNASLELWYGISTFKRINFLIKLKNYDTIRIRNQLKKIETKEIKILNNNIYLNKEEINLARKLYTVGTIRDAFILVAELLDNKEIDTKVFRISFKRFLKNLNIIEKNVKEYLGKY